MKRLFEIQTLSDYRSGLRNYTRLSDPVLIITTIATALPQFFPNLTGAERLTMQQLTTLFPGTGHWTVSYRNWLLQRVRYTKDLQRDLHMYTGQFIEANQSSICPGKTGQDCWQAFYKLLQTEAVTGGSQPVGSVFTAGLGLDMQTLLLIGVGVVLLVAVTKRRRKKR